jgi:hypothetical protein
LSQMSQSTTALRVFTGRAFDPAVRSTTGRCAESLSL